MTAEIESCYAYVTLLLNTPAEQIAPG